MKVASKLLLLLSALLLATFAVAQTNKPNTPFQHAIIIAQENRTPDNLFGSDAFASSRQLPGADLVKAGLCYNVLPYAVPLQSINLGNACDPDHGHAHAWLDTYNGGAMDGACKSKAPGCGLSYPEYTYVESSDVIPYFQIAEQYGYANYFFQTNQGPSFPAHQFLLGGTSAPIYDDGDQNDYWKWFAAENSSETDYGCTATSTVVPEVNPSGGESNGYLGGYPCYSHNTLADLLDNPPSPVQPISWKYYTQGYPPATSLWTAPNAISGICGLSGGSCQGPYWNNNVAGVFPHAAGYPKSYSPILTDLGADPNQPQCTLPGVSWVVPDGNWSDHGGFDPHGAGPSWVAAIVNAVGGFDNGGASLTTNCGYWANTVILVVWDDWGGWYDHVRPWNCNASGTCTGYDNGTPEGVGGEYVYGFRVPFLVVSAYTGTYNNGNWSGYISGACGPPPLPSCPNEQQKYVHDFGSILNFIEFAFGQNGQPIAPPGGIYPTYPYADYYAPDGPNTKGCSPAVCPY